MLSKCYYDYSMLASNYQIYYIYVLELSLIWTGHPNNCILRPFIELFVHSISLFYLFIFLDEEPISLVEVELGLGPILESEP